MSAQAHPHPLTIKQHLGVTTWRAMMAAFRMLSRLGGATPPGAVTEHAYGTHPDERLDLIEAAAEAPTRPPIVYIHGGGWICGKKEIYTSSLVPFTAAGHPVFNLEYPLAPERPPTPAAVTPGRTQLDSRTIPSTRGS